MLFARNYTSRDKATYIVSNSSAVSLSVIPSHFPRKKELKELVGKLERLLRYPDGTLTQKVADNKYKAHEEIVLIENLKPEQIDGDRRLLHHFLEIYHSPYLHGAITISGQLRRT
jgi:hypothetical protein